MEKILNTNCIVNIEKLWKSIFNKKHFSVFQSYEWNKLLEKRNRKANICYFYNDNFIAPLVISERKKTVSILGSNNDSDYLSFLFLSSFEEFSLFMDIIMDKFTGYSFVLSKINKRDVFFSYICRYLNSNGLTHSISETVCVGVDLSIYPSFFDWEQALSKNTRQNYRTSINRLKREGKAFSLVVEEKKLSKQETRKLLAIHRKRSFKKFQGSFFKKVLSFIKMNFLITIGHVNDDILSEYCLNNKILLCKLMVNNDVGTFFYGLYDEQNKSLMVPRVSTNSNVLRHSLGRIMFHNFVFYSFQNIKNELCFLDLTRGNEKYKFELGGSNYPNYKIEFKAERK